ncbi:MAG: acetylxylan esterase [Aureliella sp.]
MSLLRYLYGCFFGLTLLYTSLAGAADPLRDYNVHCPFENVPDSVEAWRQRASDLRLQLQVASGIYPEIELPAVEPQVYGAIKRDGYSIQRIVFDSLPGLKVTGSLFLPVGDLSSKKIPGILCPHGHWDEARFRDAPESEVEESLASGAERFRTAARNHIQARCVQLARMGCAVLHWDMIGYCDSQQISRDRIHGFRQQDKDAEVTAGGWLLYSPKAEMNLQSSMGLQVIAAKRAVDAMLAIDFVDPDRIAITGASGGGTQSFITAALDPRIAVAFPAVMVSTGMQGGCTCENTSLLRIGTNNVEMAALIAPRPLGLTAADDWTRDMASDGFPQLQQVYELFGAKKNVALYPAVHFGHNFNHVSRVALYGWMNRHLRLGFEEPVLETDFQLATRADLTCWDSDHEKPESGLEFERKLLVDWKRRTDAHLEKLRANDAAKHTELIKNGWRVILGLAASEVVVVESEVKDGVARVRTSSDGIAQAMQVDSAEKPGGVELQVFTSAGAKTRFYFGGVGDKEQPLVKNPRLAPCYTYGYNLPHFVRQARKLAALLQALHATSDGEQMKLTAKGADAALVVAAVMCSTLESSSFELKLELNGFRFTGIDSIRHPAFLPGAEKYGDAIGLLSCIQ